MADWNWFFSSVAQSVAALVGIMGAFLISRLLNNEASYARARTRTRELLRDADGLSDAAKVRFFDWYNDRTLESALNDVKAAVKEETDDLLPASEYYERFDFPEYLPKAECLAAIERALKNEAERREEKRAKAARAEAARSKFGLGVPAMALGDIPSMISQEVLASARIEGAAHRQMYEREREAIQQLVLSIKSHIRPVREHLDTVERQPESSEVIRLSLLAILLLFWIGVIYPLSFLPVPPTGPFPLLASAFFDILRSLRGVILAVATVIFSGLIVLLGVWNERLKHPASEITALQERLDPARYSEYLRIRLDNGIPL